MKPKTEQRRSQGKHWVPPPHGENKKWGLIKRGKLVSCKCTPRRQRVVNFLKKIVNGWGGW